MFAGSVHKTPKELAEMQRMIDQGLLPKDAIEQYYENEFMAVFGENIANGMPLGTLIGRRDLVIAAQEQEHLGADIASLAAAKAVLSKIDNEPVISRLRIGGAEIQAEVAGMIRAAGLDWAVRLEGDPAAMRLAFDDGASPDRGAMQTLWVNECLAHRLFTLGAVNMSYAHGDREIGVLLSACEQAVERLALAVCPGVPLADGPATTRAAG